MRWFLRLKKIIKPLGREKTPTILQMDSTECGAVALAIILAYFGRYVPLSDVRDACDVTRDGSKAINIIKAARRYGLDAHGIPLSLENLKQLPPPFIVYWEFNHFLVVEGFSKNKVYLNDPATGPRTSTMAEFSNGFTGVALFMNPSDHFEPGGEAAPSLFKLLWQHLRGVRGRFFYVIFVALALLVPTVSLAFFSKIFFDNILLGGQQDWLNGFLFCLFISAILMGAATGVKRHYLARLYMKLKLTHTWQFFFRLLHLPLNFIYQRFVGDIAERVEANGYLANILADKVLHNIVGMFTLFFLVLVMLFLSWPLALANILVTLINFVLLQNVSRRNMDLGRRFVQSDAKLSGIEMNGIQIIETLKANAVEDAFFNHWAAAHVQKIESEQRIERNVALLKVLPIFSQGFNIVVLLALGCWFIFQGQLTPGGLMAMQILLIIFNRVFIELLGNMQYFYKLKGDFAQIDDVNQQALENILSDSATAVSLPLATDEPILELRQIKFGYSQLEPPIFSDICLRARAGERVAIIGPSGGGKSSIAKLICGLCSPWSGEILVQGIPLSKISRVDLSHFVGLVDQKIFLFAATVRDNLTLWNPALSDDDIYQALKIVHMADLIQERGGLDGWVEECGRNFSGGQVQRLEIARALVGRPKLLILDEATAALDPLIEQQIYANLRQQQCTLVIIAHRLSAIRDCDQIVVVSGGKIVQRGKHDALIQEGGLYKELVSLEIQ